jgi:hypothetical protein
MIGVIEVGPPIANLDTICDSFLESSGNTWLQCAELSIYRFRLADSMPERSVTCLHGIACVRYAFNGHP